MIDIDHIMQLAPVIPVLVVDDVAHARPLAEALVAGGLPVLEVTLRTPAALEVIAEMAKVPGAIVGAGTVLNPDDLAAAIPAVASGGLPALKALAAPFGAARFCPTGGITQATAPEWRAQPFVKCVGGSWLYTRGETDWAAVQSRAQAAAKP